MKLGKLYFHHNDSLIGNMFEMIKNFDHSKKKFEKRESIFLNDQKFP